MEAGCVSASILEPYTHHVKEGNPSVRQPECVARPCLKPGVHTITVFHSTLSLNYLGHRERLSWVCSPFQNVHWPNIFKFWKSGNMPSPLTLSHSFPSPEHSSHSFEICFLFCIPLVHPAFTPHSACLWRILPRHIPSFWALEIQRQPNFRKCSVVLLWENNYFLKDHYGQVRDREVEIGQWPTQSLRNCLYAVDEGFIHYSICVLKHV